MTDEFPAELVERCARQIYLGLYSNIGAKWEANETKSVWYEIAIAVLRASGHAKLAAALSATLYQYRLFVGPDDAIANATIKKAKEALAAAGHTSPPHSGREAVDVRAFVAAAGHTQGDGE